jgi:hypothetical protein
MKKELEKQRTKGFVRCFFCGKIAGCRKISYEKAKKRKVFSKKG